MYSQIFKRFSIIKKTLIFTHFLHSVDEFLMFKNYSYSLLPAVYKGLTTTLPIFY